MSSSLPAPQPCNPNYEYTSSFFLPLHVQDLQSVVQQQRADMDSARDTLSALCRSHPTQELSCLSSDLTSIAKRTEAVAQRCAKTKGSLQDGLQLHFNGNTYICGIFYALLNDLLDGIYVLSLRQIHKVIYVTVFIRRSIDFHRVFQNS